MSSTRPSGRGLARPRARPGQRLRRRLALVAERRQRAREHGLGDPRQRHAELERILARPAPGALLLGLIDDHVDERAARVRVLLGEHLRRDLDEERLEVAAVPLVEDAGDLGHLEPGTVAQQVVGLGDQLDVGVLDAVVDHLHVVAGSVRADVGAARLAVDLRGDRGEGLLDLPVGVAVASRHDARAEQRALLAARHAGAEETQPALGAGARPATRVGVVGVAGVDDDVALVEQRRQLVDHGVDRRPGLDHGDDAPRPVERCHEVLDRLPGLEVALARVVLHELVGARRRAVVHGHRNAVTSDVASQVCTHHRQPGHTDLTVRAHRFSLRSSCGERAYRIVRPIKRWVENKRRSAPGRAGRSRKTAKEGPCRVDRSPTCACSSRTSTRP